MAPCARDLCRRGAHVSFGHSPIDCETALVGPSNAGDAPVISVEVVKLTSVEYSAFVSCP